MVAEARTWLGTRWVHQGRAKVGVDCAGLVIRVCHGVGLEANDMQGYRRTPEAYTFINHIRTQTDFQPEPRPGDIGIFAESQFPCHVGIFSEKHGQLHLIHGYARAGKVIEEPFIHDWPDRLVEARSLRGLTD